MFITGVGIAMPERRYTQVECWEYAKTTREVQALAPRSQALMRKIFLGDNGIEARYLALNSLQEALEMNPDALHKRFARHAPILATRAAEMALAQSETPVAEINALLVSTCTGYLCPGLTSYVSERLGLRHDAILLDLVGQGCGAALPNLRTAEALIHSTRAKRVLSVCVEICSAAFYLDDDPGVLVSACLFGDGAAASVLDCEPNPRRRVIQWKDAGSLLSAADRDLLRFEQRNGMLRNVLTRAVPGLAGKYAGAVFGEVLGKAGVRREQISTWILHAAGRQVLSALGESLELAEHDLRWSAGVLREHGNLSSPSVLFILEAALREGAPGGYWWMSAFGAGFSCHGALLKVD